MNFILALSLALATLSCRSSLPTDSLKDTVGTAPRTIKLEGKKIKAEYFENGYAKVRVDGKMGFLHKSGTFPEGLEPKFDGGWQFREGAAVVYMNGKAAFIDKKGEFLPNLGLRFDRAFTFRDGWAQVQIGETVRYVNKQGEFLEGVEIDWKYANNFSEGFLEFSTKDGIFYYDTNGQRLETPAPFYTRAESFKGGFAEVQLGEKWGYLDREGDYLVEPKYEHVRDFEDGMANVARSGRWTFINDKGEELQNGNIDFYGTNARFSEGAVAVQKEHQGKWGYIGKDGKFLPNLEPRFTVEPGSFHEGLARIADADYSTGHAKFTFSYIDRNGNLLAGRSPYLEFGGPFKDGVAVVKHKGKYGLLNKSGEFVGGKEPSYQYCASYTLSDGMVPMQVDDTTWHYLNNKGEIEIIVTTK